MYELEQQLHYNRNICAKLILFVETINNIINETNNMNENNLISNSNSNNNNVNNNIISENNLISIINSFLLFVSFHKDILGKYL